MLQSASELSDIDGTLQEKSRVKEQVDKTTLLTQKVQDLARLQASVSLNMLLHFIFNVFLLNY